MAKSRQTSAKILRSGVNAMRTVSSHAASKASGLAAHPSLRPTLMGLLMLALVVLAVMSLGRFQLWMTGAGLFMVAMSIASAVQEFKFPKTAKSYQDFLDQEMDKCNADMVTLPHVSPVKSSAAKNQQQEQVPKDETSSMALNIASPAIVNMSTPFPPNMQKPSRRESEVSIGALESAIDTTVVEETAARCNNTTEVSNKLDVLHCGTVIDIQGSHGFIIPHDLCVDAKAACQIARSGAVKRSEKQHKMPLVIPFNLNEEQAAVRQEIAVGKTVEFAYSEAAASSDSPATLCALNVTPVPTDDGIVKSRSALQSCKQAREVSFARAMEELTMISPRNVPVKHHVDLIKYAENLDDDAPFDQYI